MSVVLIQRRSDAPVVQGHATAGVQARLLWAWHGKRPGETAGVDRSVCFGARSQLWQPEQDLPR